jgi:DNA-binding PadR family transcriptional regulator
VKSVLGTRAAILQALHMPACGVELVERVRLATGGAVRLNAGSLYPALRRLEAEGLIRARSRRARGRGRPGRHYELTVRGVAARRTSRLALVGLLAVRTIDASAPDATVVATRLARCARISAAARALRDGVRAAER